MENDTLSFPRHETKLGGTENLIDLEKIVENQSAPIASTKTEATPAKEPDKTTKDAEIFDLSSDLDGKHVNEHAENGFNVTNVDSGKSSKE